MITLFGLLVVLGLSAAAPFAAAVSPQQTSSGLSGTWYNRGTNTRDIVEVQIYMEIFGGQYQWIIHAWGACEPSPCDWGTAVMNAEGNGLYSATYIWNFAGAQLTIGLEGSTLVVVNMTHFTDSSGRPDYTLTDYFVQASCSYC
jgi:hypothetical protein